MNQGDAGSPSAYEWMTQAFQRPQPQQNGVLNALSHALHWAWYGNKPGAGLGAVPGQFASSFDPRSKAGLANLASMFVGGRPEDILNEHMPGQFEAYSTGKAAAGGHLGSDAQPHYIHDLLFRARQQRNPVIAKQMIHDELFGGEVHAKGPIPKRPDTTYTESPKSQVFENGKYNNERMNAAVEKFNKTRETHGHNEFDAVAQQMKAEQDAAAAAKERIIAKQLRNHGFSAHPAEHLHAALDERAQAAHEGTPYVRVGTTHGPLEKYTMKMRSAIVKSRAGGSLTSPNAIRQMALQRLLAQHLHNHG